MHGNEGMFAVGAAPGARLWRRRHAGQAWKRINFEVTRKWLSVAG